MKLNEITKIVGIWQAVVKNAHTGETVSNNMFTNLVPTVGRTAMAAQLAGTNTQEMKAQFLAVGSDTTAPTNASTQLGVEVARKAVGSRSNLSNESSVASFFAAGEATGTHREFGAFGDGSATTASVTSNSGIMYSHVSANVTIASDETLTLTMKTSFV